MYSEEVVLGHAAAAVQHLTDRFSHETGIFSTSPSSHTIVRNLVKRMAEGALLDPLRIHLNLTLYRRLELTEANLRFFPNPLFLLTIYMQVL